MNRPLIRPVPAAPDPRELFERAADRPWFLWLDTTASGTAAYGRYAFVACDPFAVLRGRSGRSEWLLEGGCDVGSADPLDELARALDRWRIEPAADLPPFCGGAAGFFGYELGGDFEVIPTARHRDLGLPDIEIALYDLVIGWDLNSGGCWIASTGRPATGERGEAKALERANKAEAWLAGGPAPSDHRLGPSTGLQLPQTGSPATHLVPGTRIRSTFSREGYRQAVRRGIEFIRAGDVYQVNLSQRFEAPFAGDVRELYDRIRQASPAPFGSFFGTRECSVLSTSPERFLRVDAGGSVETRPIKGTRPRDPNPARDAGLATELVDSAKDRAENLMIVDLLRNDLSRVCRPWTVRATDLFRVESYATVHHLVSTVTGSLRPEADRADLLRASFPSGSVTGAPKIRAMEIIAELEPVARGPYCGAIGYLGFAGDMDTSVSIRIAVAVHGRVVFHAGGAVVADSEPDAEYEETLDKARALLSAVGEEEP